MFILENGLVIIDYPSLIASDKALSYKSDEIDKLMKDITFLRKKYKWKISYGKFN